MKKALILASLILVLLIVVMSFGKFHLNGKTIEDVEDLFTWLNDEEQACILDCFADLECFDDNCREDNFDFCKEKCGI